MIEARKTNSCQKKTSEMKYKSWVENLLITIKQ